MALQKSPAATKSSYSLKTSPLGVVHRLANPGAIPLEIIEVQSGGYLGEDDIVRFEDNYGRTEK
jgi:mannose-6-phosphate isomerase-like protein (cupin superfamily)